MYLIIKKKPTSILSLVINSLKLAYMLMLVYKTKQKKNVVTFILLGQWLQDIHLQLATCLYFKTEIQ